MKQRLGIAAALMESPDVVMLDEPTNALDSDGMQMVRREVEAARDRGATVVLACHDASVLRDLSNEIWYLAEGHIERHEEVRHAC
jgi:ABC-2 type transport system ATP-binding protein